MNIDIELNLRAHRLYWRLQRIGWVGIAIVIAAAIAGFFGNGPVAETEAIGQDLTVKYERFARASTPSEIVLGLPEGATGFWIAGEFLEEVTLSRMVPAAEARGTRSGRVEYRLEGDPGIVRIQFEWKAGWPRLVTSRAGTTTGGAVSWQQFVWP